MVLREDLKILIFMEMFYVMFYPFTINPPFKNSKWFCYLS